MYDTWIEAIEQKQFTGVCMLDMSAAFNLVNYDILLRNLKYYGFDKHSLDWMSSYLSSRTQSVSIDGLMSSPLPIDTGVPQGSKLGPLNYIIFNNELPYVIFSCANHEEPIFSSSLSKGDARTKKR